MRVVDEYPFDAIYGCCMITKDHTRAPDEKILDLDMNMLDLPPTGQLCISGKGLRLMCVTMGWEVDAMAAEHNNYLERDNVALTEENARLRAAITALAPMAASLNLADPAEFAAVAAAVEGGGPAGYLDIEEPEEEIVIDFHDMTIPQLKKLLGDQAKGVNLKEDLVELAQKATVVE